MAQNPTAEELRRRLTLEGWVLREFAGDPWIVYGSRGTLTLSVNHLNRDGAWQEAARQAEVLGAGPKSEA